MSEKKTAKIGTPMDEDPLYDFLYQILWSKEEIENGANFKLNLPDTIIFRGGSPCVWYFTDSEGVIRKKNPQQLNFPAISQWFDKKNNGSGVLAHFISISEEKNAIQLSIQEILKQKHPQMINNSKLSISLKRIQQNCSKILIAQKEEYCKDLSTLLEIEIVQYSNKQYNFKDMIEVIWTKKITLFSRRINSRTLDDPNANIFEKCVTFDGPPYLSEAGSLKDQSLNISTIKRRSNFFNCERNH